jgi:hypothetical protein
MIAGARNHRNRLASPSWSKWPDWGEPSRPCPETSHELQQLRIRWERGENLAGKWESDRMSRKPARSPAWPQFRRENYAAGARSAPEDVGPLCIGRPTVRLLGRWAPRTSIPLGLLTPQFVACLVSVHDHPDTDFALDVGCGYHLTADNTWSSVRPLQEQTGSSRPPTLQHEPDLPLLVFVQERLRVELCSRVTPHDDHRMPYCYRLAPSRRIVTSFRRPAPRHASATEFQQPEPRHARRCAFRPRTDEPKPSPPGAWC